MTTKRAFIALRIDDDGSLHSTGGYAVVASGLVESLNGLVDDIMISGYGTIHVEELGQTIVISGQDNPVNAYWDDLQTPSNALKLNPTNPPVWTSYKGSHVLSFEDQAVNVQSASWLWQLPHDYKLGTDLHPHLHIVPEDTTSGVVAWDFNYSIANIHESFPTEITVSSFQVMPEIEDRHEYHDLAEIPGSGILDVSTMLLCGLTRRSDLAEDTFDTKSVYLLEVDLHYQKDSFGSAGEWEK